MKMGFGMKKTTLIFAFFFSCLCGYVVGQTTDEISVDTWKAGVARIDITPEEPMWMAGYGSRTSPSEGVLHSIWIKALALEDASGHRSVLVTADLLGWPKDLSDLIRKEAEEKFGLSKSQIILNSSHTHTGPVLNGALLDIYPLEEADLVIIKKYTKALGEKVIQLIGTALDDMNPAFLYAENGVARFQVNRRNNSENTLHRATELKGPNDYSVPVIKVESSEGDLKAIVFGYACHPTVLSLNQWSGDYAGYAQIDLEKKYPGSVAMFFQGAGADQNPLPRRTVALAKQYGKMLAASVERILEEEMRPLIPVLRTAYDEVELDLETPPSEKELQRMAESSTGYQKRWSERLLKELQSGEKFKKSYPYPLQVWKLGDQSVFALGGELLVGYANRLKEIFGPDAFVMGYSNDVMSYIPTARVLREGGYEADQAHVVYGLPSGWTADIETVIIHGIVQLAASADVEPAE